jgi:hypothetical protein
VEPDIKANLWKVIRQATSFQVWEGLAWYMRAHNQVWEAAAECGVEPRRFAAIVAVISPATSWETNITQARALAWEGWSARLTTFNTNKVKAMAMIEGEPNGWHLSGPKVVPFWMTICDPEEPYHLPVVDRHIIHAAVGRALTDSERRKWHGMGRVSLIQDAIRDMAYGLHILPQQVQAIIWLVQKEQLEEKYNGLDIHT